jgi:hypothetical protein
MSQTKKRPFFFNSITGVSQWTFPVASPIGSESTKAVGSDEADDHKLCPSPLSHITAEAPPAPQEADLALEAACEAPFLVSIPAQSRPQRQQQTDAPSFSSRASSYRVYSLLDDVSATTAPVPLKETTKAVSQLSVGSVVAGDKVTDYKKSV